MIADSALLMGVIDEDGILEENEVFVQVKRDDFKDKRTNTINNCFESEFLDEKIIQLIKNIDSSAQII